jgi:hypothetical protein
MARGVKKTLDGPHNDFVISPVAPEDLVRLFFFFFWIVASLGTHNFPQTQTDPGLVLDQATREIDYLQEELNHANSLDEGVAIAKAHLFDQQKKKKNSDIIRQIFTRADCSLTALKIVRAVKRFLKGQDLLAEQIPRPYHIERPPASQVHLSRVLRPTGLP